MDKVTGKCNCHYENIIGAEEMRLGEIELPIPTAVALLPTRRRHRDGGLSIGVPGVSVYSDI